MTDKDKYSALALLNNRPNFGLSGILAKDTNTFKGEVVKYNEPADAKKPNIHWFLYVLKDGQVIETLPLYQQSAFLLGRNRLLADIPIDHPYCSNQHAVIQFKKKGTECNPYLIDLDSSHGTFLKGTGKLEPRRYYELFDKDLINFGKSSRDYILLNEFSAKADNDRPNDGSGGGGGASTRAIAVSSDNAD